MSVVVFLDGVEVNWIYLRRIPKWTRRQYLTSSFLQGTSSTVTTTTSFKINWLAFSIMYHSGSLSEGISLAISQNKLVACFVTGMILALIVSL